MESVITTLKCSMKDLVIGALGADVELDEISFRSKALDDKILWNRYAAAVKRGSAKVFIEKLPNRLTAAGQGGGGPLSIDELKKLVVTSKGSSRLAQGSVCHTDSAKAYKKLASDEPLPALYSGALAGPSFSELKLAHSNVKHKPPHPEFARTFRMKVWTGRAWTEEVRVGGTQKLDGFFASFRREVGKRSFNTTGPTPETAQTFEQQLHERMRVFQFLFWFSHADCFQVFAALRQAERAAVGSASWETLKSFLGDGKAPTAENLQLVEGQDAGAAAPNVQDIPAGGADVSPDDENACADLESEPEVCDVSDADTYEGIPIRFLS